MEISKFPEILGELSMRKQCVPDLFSLPTHQSLGTSPTSTIFSNGGTPNMAMQSKYIRGKKPLHEG